LNFADALAAGPPAATHGGAILLTNGSAQAAATAQYLAAHARTRYAVGGPAAAADPSAAAISGADRYATAVAVAQRLVPSPSAVGVATGAGFADALTGGPSVANRAGPMLLTPPCGSVPAALTGYLASVASGVRTGTLFGGPAAVGDDVLAQLDSALG
jgi:hypothetical protein